MLLLLMRFAFGPVGVVEQCSECSSITGRIYWIQVDGNGAGETQKMEEGGAATSTRSRSCLDRSAFSAAAASRVSDRGGA